MKVQKCLDCSCWNAEEVNRCGNGNCDLPVIGNYCAAGYIVDIVPLLKQGTNSTMFTECCHTAICRDQVSCPYCHRLVIGYDAETEGERDVIRWNNATRNWK